MMTTDQQLKWTNTKQGQRARTSERVYDVVRRERGDGGAKYVLLVDGAAVHPAHPERAAAKAAAEQYEAREQRYEAREQGAEEAPEQVVPQTPAHERMQAYLPETRAVKVRKPGSPAMVEHRLGYEVYWRARRDGDSEVQELCRASYTAYKRAYKAWLADEKAPAPVDKRGVHLAHVRLGKAQGAQVHASADGEQTLCGKPVAMVTLTVATAAAVGCEECAAAL